jgi:Protein of unknown function (DUF3662)/Inner membrane component of T3SS, cytoplasmic domain
MGILSDFERRLEGAIEGIFSKAFRGGVQPVELARRILKEMEAGRTVGVRETWVPNRFVFVLSPEDHERFQGTENALRKELEQVVRDAAASRDWGLVGPPEVLFEPEDDLRAGRFLCEASLVEGPDTSGEDAVAAAEAALAAKEAEAAAASGGSGAAPGGDGGSPRLVTLAGPAPGKVFELTKDRMVLGRLPDSDIMLADAGASRQHAEVRRQNGEWVIADLGSTNGTMVNELTIGERTLHHGDRITIGRTVLEFRGR